MKEEEVKILYKNRKGQIVERTVTVKKLKELGNKIIENDKKYNINTDIDITHSDPEIRAKISIDN